MKIALINAGKVVNVIVVTDINDAPSGYEHVVDITATEVGIDWDYDGANFTDNRPEPVEEEI